MIINKNQKNIWRYSHYYSPQIEKKFWISLGEGWTKNETVDNIILKREDQNPTGSIKDRGMAFQITHALKHKKKFLALSSSGNAAISAAAYCRKAKINLIIFLSPKVPSKKLSRLKKFTPYKIVFSKNPIQDCLSFCLKNKIDDIRPSKDKEAPEGFKSLAFEIHETLGKADNIFIPVSSGASFVGLARGYKILGYFPKLYAVQTTTHNPISRIFNSVFKKEKKSLATAICLKKTSRKSEILSFVKKSNGKGIIISNSEIRIAQKKLAEKNIFTSAEGCACFAAAQSIHSKNQKIICLLTGQKYENF
jgi:threonine synthase